MRWQSSPIYPVINTHNVIKIQPTQTRDNVSLNHPIPIRIPNEKQYCECVPVSHGQWLSWSVVRLIDWSVGQLIGWSVDRLVSWSVDRLVTRSLGQSGWVWRAIMIIIRRNKSVQWASWLRWWSYSRKWLSFVDTWFITMGLFEFLALKSHFWCRLSLFSLCSVYAASRISLRHLRWHKGSHDRNKYRVTFLLSKSVSLFPHIFQSLLDNFPPNSAPKTHAIMLLFVPLPLFLQFTYNTIGKCVIYCTHEENPQWAGKNLFLAATSYLCHFSLMLKEAITHCVYQCLSDLHLLHCSPVYTTWVHVVHIPVRWWCWQFTWEWLDVPKCICMIRPTFTTWLHLLMNCFRFVSFLSFSLRLVLFCFVLFHTILYYLVGSIYHPDYLSGVSSCRYWIQEYDQVASFDLNWFLDETRLALSLEGAKKRWIEVTANKTEVRWLCLFVCLFVTRWDRAALELVRKLAVEASEVA